MFVFDFMSHVTNPRGEKRVYDRQQEYNRSHQIEWLGRNPALERVQQGRVDRIRIGLKALREFNLRSVRSTASGNSEERQRAHSEH